MPNLYSTNVYTEQGGNKLVVASGGEIEVQSGATLDIQDGANFNVDVVTLTDTLTIGADGAGHDVTFYGDTASSYFLYDADNCLLHLIGAASQLYVGTFAASTQGSGVALSATTTLAMGVYADDGGAAVGSGTLMRAGRFRTLLTYTGGNREQEACGVIGQINSVGGVNRHNMCGVMGSYELSGTAELTVDGQVATTDAWCQAAIIGRVGVGTAKTTINTNGVLAGVAAMSNTTSFAANNGVYTAFYAGAWGSTIDWAYGLYLEGGRFTTGIDIGACTTGISFTGDATTGISMGASLAATDAILIAGANADAIHISGANTATALHISGDQVVGILYDVDAAATDGLMISVDDGITLTRGININRSGTTGICTTAITINTNGTTGIALTGTMTTGIDFTSATLALDASRTNSAIAIGDRLGEKTITMAAAVNHLDPIQMNLDIAGVNPTDGSTINGFYQLITHDTTDMASLRLKCADWNIVIGENVKDAYVYQGEIDFNTDGITVGGEAAVLGLVMNAGSDAVTGNLRGLIISMQGTGTYATAVGLELRTTCGTGLGTGLSEGIRIAGTPLPVVGIAMGNQTNDNEGPQFAFFFPSGGSPDEGPALETAESGDGAGSIAIKIGSTTKYLQYWDNPS